ncbi:hypothetical protein DESC_880054 [Desulfosarcina cetonica]|nr:hypothetical protein DESC_880054 [Desulfosarcina cetonica]
MLHSAAHLPKGYVISKKGSRNAHISAMGSHRLLQFFDNQWVADHRVDRRETAAFCLPGPHRQRHAHLGGEKGFFPPSTAGLDLPAVQQWTGLR